MRYILDTSEPIVASNCSMTCHLMSFWSCVGSNLIQNNSNPLADFTTVVTRSHTTVTKHHQLIGRVVWPGLRPPGAPLALLCALPLCYHSERMLPMCFPPTKANPSIATGKARQRANVAASQPASQLLYYYHYYLNRRRAPVDPIACVSHLSVYMDRYGGLNGQL